MALIDCPECSNKISDKAAACPRCGIVFDLDKPPIITKGEKSDLVSEDSSASSVGEQNDSSVSELLDCAKKGKWGEDKKELFNGDESKQLDSSDEINYYQQAPAFISIALLFSYIFYIVGFFLADWSNRQQGEFMAERFPVENMNFPICFILGLVCSLVLWWRGIGEWFISIKYKNSNSYHKKKTVNVWLFMLNYFGLILLFLILWALVSFLVSFAMITVSISLKLESLRGTYIVWLISGFVINSAVWIKIKNRFSKI